MRHMQFIFSDRRSRKEEEDEGTGLRFLSHIVNYPRNNAFLSGAVARLLLWHFAQLEHSRDHVNFNQLHCDRPSPGALLPCCCCSPCFQFANVGKEFSLLEIGLSTLNLHTRAANSRCLSRPSAGDRGSDRVNHSVEELV